MAIVRNNEVQPIETPGGNFSTGIATADRGARETSVIRQRQLPGGTNPGHTHDCEEILVMLAGAATVTVAGEPWLLGPGDVAIIPPQVAHRIENTGTQPAEWLLVARAGRRFFSASGEEVTPLWSH